MADAAEDRQQSCCDCSHLNPTPKLPSRPAIAPWSLAAARLADRRGWPALSKLVINTILAAVVSFMGVEPALASQKPRVDVSKRTVHQPVIQKITFSKFATVPLTDSDIDLRLQQATTVFQKKSATVCPIKFLRKNSQVIFSGTGLDQLTSRADYDAINNNPAVSGIRVKSIINVIWCGGPNPNAIGCSDMPGGNIIVQNDGTNNWSPTDFAHEFGHNQGLDDLHGTANQTRVMYGDANVGPTNDVTAEECRAFQKRVSF